jgi:hypothetical protein
MSLIDWFKSLLSAGDGDTAIGSSPGLQPRGQALGDPGQATVRGLDFEAAIKAHQAWKGRLSSLVAGASTERLDYRIVCRDDQCILGQWIHGDGRRVFGGTALFESVRVTHAQFHQLAGQVVLAVEDGRPDDARQLLRTDYQRASVRVQGRLAELFISTSTERSGRFPPT